MPAAKRAAPAGSAPPAMRDSTRGAGLAASTAGSTVVGTDGTTVLTGVPLWHRVLRTPRKLWISGGSGLPSAGSIPVPRSADWAAPGCPPRGGPGALPGVPILSGPSRPPRPRRPRVPGFLRTVAVPWGGTAVVLVVGVVEFLLDGGAPPLPVPLAVLGL